ncbi:protein WBSCR14 homolog isoform X1 [Zeugodacus cucurbitae]|uniref:MLX-interacting protein n=1 Tax=Zeugodacus cucurbitae TaxID=28588 RepID=A0A0A1WMZ8_ZEUCU|nr:protein WBSCR14 homolog isoform X1 [Zeugodacus cucurbitae]XP_011192830.1 protein WBSCR14 homolog isoform X1 [Zeugodacus cucurbitae]XP_028900381.1 protein WBSCR14 homolog isoform X1 [Zeugodacus cucurbitae]XP_028900382.1 protein WBSCR14 homolog isoform X1 [Zeugodacus cucurbitae]XP_054082914.1 protein WBSCR14 homolog isoform X1 [Zeugodacus cucurbitae]
MMLNKYQNYLQQQQNQHQQIVEQQQQQSCGGIAKSVCSGDPGLSDYGAMASNISKSERESIHSGQFMVSHFEAEEAQEDDLEEDDEVKMIDPEDINLTKSEDIVNTCTDVQRFVPRKISYVQELGQEGSVVASHLEIETSLTKLFKCMNLAYSQKLTSPKWNHFKGIRLRWKDKIRLNNVIWRCWHMQFILKRRTPVCQFASPLDVDIHSNPQAVVLEGKYWKRQTTVIKAEYRKWRKNSKSKTAGCLTYDTKSEFDFLEWSPLNDRMLMIPDDWTNDTLFSSINGPFPFPDPREIARGAGIADFIQPGLGSLQPNIDDIDLTIDALFFSELLQPNRLPPVPEEGTDEMLKNVEYNLSAIMGTDQLESNSMVGVVSGNNSNAIPVNDDANMLDLNAPLDSLQFQSSMVQQRYPAPLSRENSNSQLLNTSGSNQAQALNTVDAIMTDDHSSTVGVNDGLGSSASATTASSTMRMHSKHFPAASEGVTNNRSSGNEFPSKSVMKGRISKNSQRSFSRREPHNYDKAQPTLHQTTIYQQMLAEQQKSQQSQHLQPTLPCTALQHHTIAYHQQQQQQQMQAAATQYPTSSGIISGTGDNGSGTVYGGYGSVDISASANSGLNVNNNLLNISMVNQKPKSYAIIQTTTNCMPSSPQINVNNSPHTANSSILLQTVKTEPPSTDMLSIYNLNASNDLYGINTNLGGNSNSNAYKPYPSVSNFKKSASTGGYINMRVNTNSPYMHDQSTNAHHVHQQSLPPNLGCQVTTLSSPLQLQVQAHCQLSPSSSHQHQQQQQSTQHLLTTQQQHPMQQLSQQQQSSVNMMPREMFRSNSLPLNVTLQKLESRSSHDNFAVPKYQAKNNKPRSRSNSIHQHSIVAPSGANKSSSAASNNLLVSSQLQSATSDPMLNNSTLAQLLTTNSRSLLKKQSSSSSAISNVNIPMPALSMPAVVVPPPASSAISVNTNKSQNIGSTPTSANFFATPNVQCTATNASGTSADSTYTRHGMQMHQEQMQKSPKKSTSLPNPAAPQMLHSPPCSKMMSYPPTASQAAMCSNTLSLSPESFHDQDSPLSPTHSLKFPRDNQRRAGHIHAEQKRRYNIKNGFDLLHSLIPQLQQNPNAKLSKAAMLQKGADHIKHLRAERNQLKDHMEALLKERDILNNSLTHLHSILPANGAPVTRQGTEHVRQLYDQYVRHRTMQDWKFWILGLILEPLLSSYTASVSSASLEELRRTAFLWVDQHCSLIDLRPAVSNKLKYLSMKTDILSDPPSTLQDEVAKAVYNNSGHHPNLHGT